MSIQGKNLNVDSFVSPKMGEVENCLRTTHDSHGWSDLEWLSQQEQDPCKLVSFCRFKQRLRGDAWTDGNGTSLERRHQTIYPAESRAANTDKHWNGAARLFTHPHDPTMMVKFSILSCLVETWQPQRQWPSNNLRPAAPLTRRITLRLRSAALAENWETKD